MDPVLDYTREASSRYQQVSHRLKYTFYLLLSCLQVLVQDPYRKWNAARAVTSAKHWEKIKAELKHSVKMISEQSDVGFDQLCQRSVGEEDEVSIDLQLVYLGVVGWNI